MNSKPMHRMLYFSFSSPCFLINASVTEVVRKKRATRPPFRTASAPIAAKHKKKITKRIPIGSPVHYDQHVDDDRGNNNHRYRLFGRATLCILLNVQTSHVTD
jgi:hypothetical protein